MVKADEIIDKVKDKYGFVINIDNVIAYLGEKNCSLKEKNEVLYAILGHNHFVDIKCRNELNLSKRNFITKEEKKEISKRQPSIPIIGVKTDLFDVSQYIEDINNYDDLELLTDILPTIDENNYENTIFSLILYYAKEIKEYSEFLASTNDPKEKEEILADIARLKSIYNTIKNYDIEERNEVVENTSDTKKCNLFYLKKSNGGYYIDDDIDSIAMEDYTAKAFLDVADGSSKGREKKLSTAIKKHSDVFKYRQRSSRTILVRIDDENVVVLATLNKHFQTSTLYDKFLLTRSDIYHQQIQQILERMHDEEFIAENNAVTKRIIEKLKQKKKILNQGDNNE